MVFDNTVANMNNYIERIAKFEYSTNNDVQDMWRIKDMAY